MLCCRRARARDAGDRMSVQLLQLPDSSGAWAMQHASQGLCADLCCVPFYTAVLKLSSGVEVSAIFSVKSRSGRQCRALSAMGPAILLPQHLRPPEAQHAEGECGAACRRRHTTWPRGRTTCCRKWRPPPPPGLLARTQPSRCDHQTSPLPPARHAAVACAAPRCSPSSSLNGLRSVFRIQCRTGSELPPARLAARRTLPCSDRS